MSTKTLKPHAKPVTRRSGSGGHMAAAAADCPTEDEIRQRAYQRWVEASMPEGDGVQFWLEAEQELRHRLRPPG